MCLITKYLCIHIHTSAFAFTLYITGQLQTKKNYALPQPQQQWSSGNIADCEVFLLEAMAPKSAKSKAAPKKTAKELKDEKEKAADLKRRQSNLATQGKNAVAKLQKVKDGSETVSSSELALLETKVQFYNEYQSLPRNSQGKLEMLASFDQDKSGYKWLNRAREIGETKSETVGDQSGYLSSALDVSLKYIFSCRRFSLT